jgi:hypothetical protein
METKTKSLILAWPIAVLKREDAEAGGKSKASMDRWSKTNPKRLVLVVSWFVGKTQSVGPASH